MPRKKIIYAVIIFIFLFSFILYLSNKEARVNPKVETANVSSVNKLNNNPEYPVTRVIDGDTIIVDINGKDEKLRLIGVNTPETVDPRKKVQCFGREANNFVKNMLTGKSVTLEADPTQSDRDKYGRLLRYVYLDDILVNEEIISSGYGYEYTYQIPYKFQSEFKASEAYAKDGGIGLWATTTCGGKF